MMESNKASSPRTTRKGFPIPSFLTNSAMSAADSETGHRNSGSGFIPK